MQMPLSVQFSSVQFSRSVTSDSLQPHESQHARPPCPLPAPGVHSDSCPSNLWCLQPSHPLSSPSPPAPNPSPNQSLFQWVNFSHEVMTPKSYFLLSTIIHCHLVLSRWIFFMLYFLNSFPGLIRLKWACKFSLLNTWSCAVMSVCENSCVFPLLPARQALLLRVSVYFLFIFPGSPSLAPASVHGLFLQMR